jgi:hypothetical protein
MPAAPPATATSDPSLRQLLRQLWAHLARRRRLQLGVLLLVMLASSLAEVLSLAAVLPFLAVLANPEGLWNQPLVQQWAPRLGIASPSDAAADHDCLCSRGPGGRRDPAAEPVAKRAAGGGDRLRPEL